MFPTILLIHKIVVTLFLVHYVVKLVLLFANKEGLVTYTKATRIIEMIISVLFLVTGVWLVVNSQISMLMVVKLVCVFASIPLAIVGFKKGNKMLATLAILLILGAYGLAEVNKKQKSTVKVDTSNLSDPLAIGKQIYNVNCSNCHGEDGKLGMSGAKDLSLTTLTADEQKAVIKNGKGNMPPYGTLTEQQLDGLAQYIATLKR